MLRIELKTLDRMRICRGFCFLDHLKIGEIALTKGANVAIAIIKAITHSAKNLIAGSSFISFKISLYLSSITQTFLLGLFVKNPCQMPVFQGFCFLYLQITYVVPLICCCIIIIISSLSAEGNASIFLAGYLTRRSVFPWSCTKPKLLIRPKIPTTA